MNMTDEMVPIKGYFKVEVINKDQEVESTYEDYNTVMTRIPALLAGVISGAYERDVPKYFIHAFAIGTDGLNKNGVPKTVTNTRIQMFSEENFWLSRIPGNPAVAKDINKKRVFQRTWVKDLSADSGFNPAGSVPLYGGDQGSTLPLLDPNNSDLKKKWRPKLYRDFMPNFADPTIKDHIVQVRRSNLGTELSYVFNIGQECANDGTSIVDYTEAALYLQLDANYERTSSGAGSAFPENTGQPLGQLFSMKTFPAVKKSQDCAIRVTWKLFF